jgi:hypothetical protein
MPPVGFEHTIPLFERSKAVHALDCAATMIGSTISYPDLIFFFNGSTALVGPGRYFRFPDLFTGGRTPWASDQLVARPLPKHTTTQTQKNTYTHL